MVRNKKGFTLAELLIVVGIIAVLTAIAVPLFVGALNNANSTVEQANIRAVRAEAVGKILLAKKPADAKANTADPNGIYTCQEKSGAEGTFEYVLKGPWAVTAYISQNGGIVGKIEFSTTGVESVTDACVTASAEEIAAHAGAYYKVTLKLSVDDLNA